MATQPAKSAGKSSKSKPKSNRGGARPGSGRKPKPVEEIRLALKADLIPPTPPPAPASMVDAASAALGVLRTILDDTDAAPKDRIAAAREILNRTIGRAREAEPEAKDDETGPEHQVHIFMPHNGRDQRETGT